jgi:drug/metabolite transporter (DMT)-like permease
MPPPKLDPQGLSAALCATASWGMSGIFIRWLPGWSPFLVLVGRFLVAIAVMLPILFFRPSIRTNLTHSLTTPLIWGLSLPAIGSYILGTSAIQMAPVGEVTLLFTTSPLFVITYKSVMRLPVKRSESFGMLLAMVGVSLIMLPKIAFTQAISWKTIAGYILALGAAGLVSLYAAWSNALAQKKLAPKTFTIVFATFILGSLLSFLGAICFSKLSIGEGMNRSAILIFLGLGILSTALPFFCYTVAAQRLPIMLSSAILLLEPLFAVLFASIALQEIPSLWVALGSFLVFGGLLFIASGGKTL